MDKRIVLLFGPSGSGKSVLSKKLFDLGYVELISSTTREPRAGEINGKDYYFLTAEEFEKTKMIEKTQYNGNWYGTEISEIRNKFKQSDKLFAVVDKNGLEAFRELYRDTIIGVYVYASLDILEKHMREGRNDPQDKIEARLKNTIDTGELNNIHLADYVIINNKSIEESFELLKFMLGEK